jgi:hypothetical protein
MDPIDNEVVWLECYTDEELDVLIDEARRERHREAWSEYVEDRCDN